MTKNAENSWLYKWSPIIVSVIALYLSYLSYDHAKQVSIQHIEPTISTEFIYPQQNNPYIVFQNNSPIECVSVSVDCKLFIFDKDEGCIVGGGRHRAIAHGFMVFESNLKPMESIDRQVARISKTENRAIIYKLDVVYHRESDMKVFNDTFYYFVDEGKKISHTNFRNNRYYKQVITDIAYFEKNELKEIDINDDDALARLKRQREHGDLQQFEFHTRKGMTLENEGILITSVE